MRFHGGETFDADDVLFSYERVIAESSDLRAYMHSIDRVEVVDVRILITAILVQREVGGNLAEILERIAETMRERFNLKRQVRVYTAQGRMSGYTLAALPIFVGLAVSVINPEYMQTLYLESFGRGLLVSAAILWSLLRLGLWSVERRNPPTGS